MSKGRRLAVQTAAVLLALWIVRPLDNLNPVQCFFYFANFYMFGILFCEYRKQIMLVISRPAVIAAIGAMLLVIASVQAMVLQFPGNLERTPADGLGFVGVDAMLIQKYFGVLFFCGLLTHVAGWLKKPLNFLADHSFGLLFIHGIVIAVLMSLPQSF